MVVMDTETGSGKSENLHIRCKPSVKKDFRVMAAELERSHGDTLELCIQAYRLDPTLFKTGFR